MMRSVSDSRAAVDVIIPVYGGVAEVRACLESVLASTNEVLGNVIVVNDCSPEPEIGDYLQRLADAALITLLVNEENQGFVRSCNQGAALRLDHDFVLLNADTEVHGDWLDRMAAHARGHPQVATVTPFSNNATIASYPWGGNARSADTLIDVAVLDRAMAGANGGESVSLPTAIGFCMFVAREAWQASNGFDERYGRGYGEEVEFCLSTAAAGWDHLLACDVFVYHAGNVSFGYESEQLKIAAQTVVDQRYPDFSAHVQDWIKRDPALPARLRCDLERLQPSDGPRILHVSHRLGGGVSQYVEDLSRACREVSGCLSLVMSPWGESAICVETVGGEGAFSIRLPEAEAERLIPEFLLAFGVQRIHYHHYAGQPRWVLDLPSKVDLPFDITIHDFVAACPQFHFQDQDGRFCGRPNDAGCNACIAERPNHWDLEIVEWREAFSGHLMRAERVICPSISTAEAIRDYYPDVTCSVWPHADTQTARFSQHQARSQSRIKVAVVGALSLIKGFDVVASIVRRAEEADLPLDFAIIGPTIRPLNNHPRALVTGPYRREDLPDILLRERPDCFLFASQIPETFNYALSACLATGLPIIAVASGAMEERLREVPQASLLPASSDTGALLEVLLAQRPTHVIQQIETAESRIGFVSPAEYAERYLAPLDPSEPLVFERLLEVLTRLAEVEKPLAAPLPPIEELLNAALEQRHAEAQAALRHHTLDTHAILQEREAHLHVRAEEVEHLTQTIHGLHEAHAREEHHLKSEIASLQEANAADVLHLKEIVDALQAEQGEISKALDRSFIERDQILAERNVFAERVLELETSTLWRLMTPLRWTLHGVKLGIERMRPLAVFSRKVYVFSRYHYSTGGWRGLRSAAGRRWHRWRRRETAMSPTADGGSDWLAVLPGSPVAFNDATAPQLSIVIPSFGEHAVTAHCLRSISACPPSVSFEVIVADDAYPDPFDPTEFDISGVRLIRQPHNLGFLRNCNHAVSQARGDRVLLLNNDTQLVADAIDALWRTFQQFSGVGAVGAKLCYPDGALQEAGGIIWRDGSGWNWGRDEDASLPRFNYVREADYCSAAALMVDRAAWSSVGGFDEQFAPCYYEDTDLCFALREAGWRTLYQPAATVVHFEGVSHGTDVNEGQKAYQLRNQALFAAKWSQQLSKHASNGEAPQRECDRGAQARILWVEACMLTPDQDSGSLRTVRLLRILRDLGCKVTFAADNLLADEPYAQRLRDEGIEVLHVPHVKSMRDYLQAHGGAYDVVTLCRHYIAIQYVELIRDAQTNTQIWFDTIDLHYLRLQRQHQLDGAAATLKMAELAHQEELAVIAQSDLTIVVSEAEVSALAAEAPAAPVALISNIHEIDASPVASEGRRDVLFVGGFQHPPNSDAVEYFGEEIWPLFRATCPEAEVLVIGSRMPDSLKRWGEAQGLTMLGFVEDLTPYYQRCKLVIAPLRYGAGVKGKVNQALSYGVPVVGSPMALEGMGLENRRDAMFASTPEAFAQAMAEVYGDQGLWNTLSANGRESLQGRFTPDVAKRALLEALGPLFKRGG
jgi:O-antigen biosynthesis protein